MRKVLTLILTVCMLIGAIPVYATGSKDIQEKKPVETEPVTHELSDYVVDQKAIGTLNIEYKESNDPSKSVSGAQFTIYMVATMNANGGYDSLIPDLEVFDRESNAEEDVELVKKAYARGLVDPSGKHTRTTNSQGFVDFPNIPHGLYLVEESQPAEDHLASIPFYAAIPFMEAGAWEYTAIAKPKSIPTGRLSVEKKVEGDAGEKDREFTFLLSLDVDGVYEYEMSGGEKGKIEHNGFFHLSDGQKITIKDIPSGTKYKVTEKEENQDGYITKATGSSDVIESGNPKTATFVNTKNKADKSSSDAEKKGSGAQTGDSNFVIIVGGIFLAAILALAVLLIKRKQLNAEK